MIKTGNKIKVLPGTDPRLDNKIGIVQTPPWKTFSGDFDWNIIVIFEDEKPIGFSYMEGQIEKIN
jgi:hypothetical protein